VAAEVERSSLDPFAVLRRGVDPSGESRRDLRPARAADPAFGPVFGDLDADGREVEDLAAFAPGGVEFAGARAERLAAFGAALVGSDAVLDDVVGICDLPQGIARMPFLAARLAPGLAPQAPGLGRVAEVARIRGGRLAAVAAVAAVALQRSDLGFQCFDALPKRKHKLSDGPRIALGQLNQLLKCWSIC